eukprot:gene5242-18474_t
MLADAQWARQSVQGPSDGGGESSEGIRWYGIWQQGRNGGLGIFAGTGDMGAIFPGFRGGLLDLWGLQLKETFTPAVTLTLMIKAQPSWTYWEENWRPVVDELMAYAAPGSIYNIQAQPLGQVRIIHPLRFSDRSQYGKDLLVEKGRREDALRLIAKHEWGMTVSYLTPQNFTAAFLRQPIYVDQTGPDDFFNYSFPGANYTLAKDGEDRTYPPVPLGEAPYGYYKNCSVCYNASTAGSNSSRWWGFATVGGTVNQASAEFVEVNVPNAVWVLWVEPEDGWNPVWEAGLVAGVVIIALVISCLLGAFLWMHARQGELLQESRATSAILEKTAQELTREKDRLDTMLVRQYDLMNCFSMKSMAKGLTKSQHKLTVDNIEEARTGVNRANNSNTGRDMLEIGQLLGEGAEAQTGVSRANNSNTGRDMLEIGQLLGEGAEARTGVNRANNSNTGRDVLEIGKLLGEGAEARTGVNRANNSNTGRDVLEIGKLLGEGAEARTGVNRTNNSNTGRDVLEIGQLLGEGAEARTGANRTNKSNTGRDVLEIGQLLGEGAVRLVIQYCDKGTLTDALKYCDKGTLTDALKAKAFTSREGTIIFTGMVMVALDIARAMVHMHATEVRDIHAAHFGHAITKLRKRPTFPIFAPKKYVELAQECWANDAGKRPSFDAIMERLNALLALQPKLNGLLSLPSFEELPKLNGPLALPASEEVTPDYTPLKKVSESVLNQSTSSIGIQLIDSGDGVDLSNPGSAFRIGYGKPLPVFVPPVLVALPEGDEGAVTDEALGALPEGEGARKP